MAVGVFGFRIVMHRPLARLEIIKKFLMGILLTLNLELFRPMVHN
jgi:hypothetical protein